MDEVINRVAKSGLVTVDLSQWAPDPNTILGLDIAQWLEQGLLLKEDVFKSHLNAHDWERYEDKVVGVYCSTDAIVAPWAYLLIATHLEPFTPHYYVMHPDQLYVYLFLQKLTQVNWQEYRGKKVLLKGCGDVPAPVFMEATKRLLPLVEKLMYGEACSNVPIYRRK